MKKNIKLYTIVLLVLFSSLFGQEIFALDGYVNEKVDVTFYFNSPVPVAAQIQFESNVSLSKNTDIVGDPVNEVYKNEFSSTTSFTPTTPGNYTVTAKVKASDEAGNPVIIPSKTITVTVGNRPAPEKPIDKPVERPADKRSSNNFLNSLSVSPGGINFNKNTGSYQVIVDNSVSSLSISGSAEDSKASVSGTGSKNLSVYDNKFTVTVNAENGAAKYYTITVIRRDSDGNTAPLSTNNNLSSLTVSGCDLGFSADKLAYECEVDNLIDSVDVVATQDDSKATVQVIKPDSLVVGPNEIKVIVTSESDATKEYVINVTRSSDAPTVEMADLADALKKLTSDEISVVADASGVISKDIISQIKESKIILNVIKKNEAGDIVYQWKFDGSKIVDTFDIKLNLKFNENIDKFDKLSNYAKGMVLTFDENKELPKNTQVGIFVGEEFSKDALLNLYYYDSEADSLTLQQKDISIVDGFVWINLEHTSQYFLTPVTVVGIKSSISAFDDLWVVSTAALTTITMIALLVIISDKRKIKKMQDRISLSRPALSEQDSTQELVFKD
ncbi:MAG: cadherin-like beta sandwich domain-containing protein [Erysipelothrix sp.]|nr:cadherin-like beta sandwich domain-containing protein [Erysipelothrix sp.]